MHGRQYKCAQCVITGLFKASKQIGHSSFPDDNNTDKICCNFFRSSSGVVDEGFAETTNQKNKKSTKKILNYYNQLLSTVK